jgi:hypothetical protein
VRRRSQLKDLQAMRQFGIAAGLGVCMALSACGPDAPEYGEPYVAPSIAEQEKAIFGEVNPSELPANQRAALAHAHAVTAVALYRAGEADGAAAHAAQIDAGAHPGLMVGLDTMGFDPAVVAAVAAAPEDERAAEAARVMLASMRPGMTGEVKATTEFLMKSLAAEYEAGADAGTIVDLHAYQTAFGLAVTARDIVAAQDPEIYGKLTLDLEILVRMWPGEGPLATSTPAPDSEMALALSNVKSALAALP